MALNEQTGEISAKPVTDLIRPAAKELYELHLLNHASERTLFRATDDHPWKVKGKGWVDTADLRAGDRIDTASGRDLLVTSIARTGQRAPTYTLTVDEWHTSFVGKERAVVHNAICGKSQEKLARQMEQRGWTDESIEEAKQSGQQVNAVNKRNGNPATSYIHPVTGQLVIIDNITGEILMVGGPGFSLRTGKWRCSLTETVTVYVYLVDEAVDAWKPMQASFVSDGKYIIIGDEADPDFDSLEFKSGETVICEEEMLSNGRVLVAVKSAGC